MWLRIEKILPWDAAIQQGSWDWYESFKRRSRIIRAGRRIVVAKIDLYNEHEVRIAKGTGTYLIGWKRGGYETLSRMPARDIRTGYGLSTVRSTVPSQRKMGWLGFWIQIKSNPVRVAIGSHLIQVQTKQETCPRERHHRNRTVCMWHLHTIPIRVWYYQRQPVHRCRLCFGPICRSIFVDRADRNLPSRRTWTTRQEHCGADKNALTSLSWVRMIMVMDLSSIWIFRGYRGKIILNLSSMVTPIEEWWKTTNTSISWIRVLFSPLMTLDFRSLILPTEKWFNTHA